jgi:hypothetical protein
VFHLIDWPSMLELPFRPAALVITEYAHDVGLRLTVV